MAGCGVPTRPAGTFDQEGVLLGLYTDDAYAATLRAMALVDLSWLQPGQSVLVKLACNSGHRHPSVTAPGAVRGMVEALLAAGAGRVVVADQAGVEAVRLAEGNQRYGSTRSLMARNGLLDAIEESGGEAHFFDEEDFDEGYFPGTTPFDSYWTQPMMLPSIVNDVDHIVYMPRLSSHTLCGYTHGLKLSMGWIRDDSRYHVHHKAEWIYEKYVEINYATEIASRLRLTFTVAESVLLDAGPDDGTIVDLDQTVVVASPSLANHDAVSVAVLAHFDDNADRETGLGYGAAANSINYLFLTSIPGRTGDIPWGPGQPGGYTSYAPHRYQQGVQSDRALRRAYELTGGQPEAIELMFDGESPTDALLDGLTSYSRGLLSV